MLFFSNHHTRSPRAIAWCALEELPIGASGKALRRAARAAFAARLIAIT